MTQGSVTRTTSRLAVRRAVGWLLAGAWAGVIFWFSTRAGTQIPSGYSDQGHLGEYLIFGVLLYIALRVDLTRSQALSLAIVIASCYGMTDEFHQHFVVGRTPDILDWGVDTIGATLGVTLAHGAAAALARRRP